ncbi:MAG: hypothetical protein AB7D38_12175 [Sulfurimonas sp.]|uniref:portal protein n=1 Tax=Sulfurimonas sp. TaxID=2022749 RepID=UPI003D116908
MKVDIQTLKDTFKISQEVFSDSREESMKVQDYFHNRQYTNEQINILENRGQPKETFNIVKLFGRMLLGYYSTVVNEVRVSPVQLDDIYTSSILNDLINYVFNVNNFSAELDKIKLDGILTGLMCSYVNVSETGETDQFGRPKYEINISHVPTLEIALDPLSKLEDYSDARYIHRFKWLSDDQVKKAFGEDSLKKLVEYHNNLDIDEAEFEYQYNIRFHGNYKYFNNYLIVHTIIKDEDSKSWSIYWCGDEILSKEEVTYKKVPNPYRVHKVHSSNKAEFYGIFREVLPTQDAINQALIKIQLMVNTQKVFVEEGAVNSIDEFKDAFDRINAVIPVISLSGIKVENLTREVLDQYNIIDKAFNRIQRVLSINDSFLGMAYASDSGAKVKLQQNASIVALRYFTAKIEQFIRLLGWDVLNLIQQYFTAHDVVRIADTFEGDKWVEINRPITIPTGNTLPDGTPEMRYVFEEVKDPASGKPMVDDDGNFIMAPIPTLDTEIAFTKADITVASVAYNDEDEKSQALLDSFINGPFGQVLSQVNPVGYLKAGSLAVKNTRTKFSLELSKILEETAEAMGGNINTQRAMQHGSIPGQMSMEQAMNQMPGRPSRGNA